MNGISYLLNQSFEHMKKLKLLLICILVISVLVCPKISAQIIYGVVGHPMTSVNYKPFSFGEQMKLVKKNGFSWYRFEILMDDSNHVINRNGSLIDLIKEAKLSNVNLLPSIKFNNLDFNKPPQIAYNNGRMQGEQFIINYGKYFSVIELGNEVNLMICKYERHDGLLEYDKQKAEILMNYLKGMIDGIRSKNSTVKIIIGISNKDYHFFELTNLYSLKFDIVGNTRYGNENYNFSINKMFELTHKPIWILELNHAKGSTNIDYIKQSGWINAKLKELTQNKYVKAIFIYQLFDENFNLKTDHPSEANYGIYRITSNNELVKKFNLNHP